MLVAELDDSGLVAKCETLYPREADVLRRWNDQSAKEIAGELRLSVHTVNGYANDARQKLGVASTRQAARLFRKYEALKAPPTNLGGQFQRVPHEIIDASGLSGGFSKPQDDYRGDNSIIRRGGFLAWLRRLGSGQWLGLILATALAVIAVFTLGAVVLLGVFEVLQQFGGPHR